MSLERIEATKKSIFTLIGSLDQEGWVARDFKRILDDDIITNILKVANTETAVRKFLNRHGIEHGLNVANYAANLFWLIYNDYVSSDFKEEYGFSKSAVLFMLLTAGYIHDCGRFFDPETKNHEERVGEIVRRLQFFADRKLILGSVRAEKQDPILIKVEELCVCHDKKYNPSGKVEIGIIKLADALDCNKNRVYDEEDKPEFGKWGEEDYQDKIQTIVLKDKKPERYFGPRSIDKVDLVPMESLGLVQASFTISDTAAYGELKSVLDVLTMSKKSESKNVKNFANRVRVRIIDTLHPQPFFIYPENPVYLPGASILYTGYDVEILDEDGTSDVIIPIVIKNENNSGGLRSHVCMLGGREKVAWDEVEIKEFFEVKRMFENVSEIRETDRERLSPLEYLYSGKKGVNHYFNVVLPRKISVDDTLRLLGVFRWKKFFEVPEDAMNHIVATSTKKLFFDIRFPKEIEDPNKVNATFEIRNPNQETNGEDAVLVYSEVLKPTLVNHKVCLRKTIANPCSRGMKYTLKWKIS